MYKVLLGWQYFIHHCCKIKTGYKIMRKIVVSLTIVFFMHCLPHELNYQPAKTSSFSREVFSDQSPPLESIFSCDNYKHRNNFFLPLNINLDNYTAHQLQHYFHKNNYSEKQILDQELLYLSDEFVKLAK